MPDMLYVTRAEIDLGAIEANARICRELAEGREVIAAVKADAYGHGAVPVARRLESTGLADALAVATTPEGIELRKSGINLPILKLSPALSVEEIDAALDHRVSLTVQTAEEIRAVGERAGALGVDGHVHLAVETGMGRVGCAPEQAVALARRVSEEPSLVLKGVFTHCPVADVASGREFTVDQLDRFRRVAGAIQSDRRERGLEPVELIHAANSGALVNHDLAGLTAVRPGIVLYGYEPDPCEVTRPLPWRPAMRWVSELSTVKAVRAGTTVGYGRSWTCPTDRWIGTVPAGYADGFSRLNSNRGTVLVGGRRVPVAGRVCMDQFMVDLGEAGDPATPPARPGDEVVLIGRQGDEVITADDMADVMGTISYEVTCLVGPRVPRQYVG